jgi:hypothetical protein
MLFIIGEILISSSLIYQGGYYMEKKSALKVINPIIAILIVNQAASATLRGLIGSEAFEILHEGGGILLLIGVMVHVILNWGWVKSAFFKKG